MEITNVVWLTQFVEKIERKHGVSTDEVEEVFNNRPRVQRIERGDVSGENLYRALGRTDGAASSRSSFSIRAGAARW